MDLTASFKQLADLIVGLLRWLRARFFPDHRAILGRRFVVAQSMSRYYLYVAVAPVGGLDSLVLIGDLEQSIFSFQGASAAGCRKVADDHGLREISLSENHRCSQKTSESRRLVIRRRSSA